MSAYAGSGCSRHQYQPGTASGDCRACCTAITDSACRAYQSNVAGTDCRAYRTAITGANYRALFHAGCCAYQTAIATTDRRACHIATAHLRLCSCPAACPTKSRSRHECRLCRYCRRRYRYLRRHPYTQLTFHIDSAAAQSLASQASYATKSQLRHVDARQEWVQALRDSNLVQAVHIDTFNSLTDVFTKAIPLVTFLDFRKQLMHFRSIPVIS